MLSWTHIDSLGHYKNVVGINEFKMLYDLSLSTDKFLFNFVIMTLNIFQIKIINFIRS